jgi:hypothetical protein
MGLFSKKRETDFDSLPELPQLPKTIAQSMNSRPTSTLPSMPATDTANRWSMQAVKDAIGEQSPVHAHAHDNEYSDYSSGEEEVIEPGQPRIPVYRPQTPQTQIRKEPLFVRIDKFEGALRDFEDISVKVKRIEELITEIKSLREKEDREFLEWEKDLHIIKSRLDSIDRTLFSQLD